MSAFFGRDFAAGAFAFGREVSVALDTFFVFELPEAIGFWTVVFGSRSSLRRVTVAGVHVEVEETAARIESAEACNEAIMISRNSKYTINSN